MKKRMAFINRIDWSAISPSVYIRYILMALTILNTILTRLGLNPIQASAEEVYQYISDAVAILILVVNTWKNNSITREAIAADTYISQMKSDGEKKEEAQG